MMMSVRTDQSKPATGFDAMIRWWRQPDHFVWATNYLAEYNRAGFARLVMLTMMIVAAAEPIMMLNTPTAPQSPVRRAILAAVSAGCVGLSALWLRHWPTRNQSLFFCVAVTTLTGLVCVVLPDPMWAMVGTLYFVGCTLYTAVMHTAPYLVTVLSIALGTAAVQTVRVGSSGNWAGAVSFQVGFLLTLLAPAIAGQLFVQVLRADAAHSRIDPLTGLYNRRGFYRIAHTIVDQQRAKMHDLAIGIDRHAVDVIDDPGREGGKGGGCDGGLCIMRCVYDSTLCNRHNPTLHGLRVQ